MVIRHVHILPHARKRIEEREISEDAIKDVLKYGRIKEKTGGGPNGAQCYKIRKESGKDALVVVANVLHDECWVVTAYRLSV